MLYVFQIGKEHVGLKAVTEILQDIQYKVGYDLKENSPEGLTEGQLFSRAWFITEKGYR